MLPLCLPRRTTLPGRRAARPGSGTSCLQTGPDTLPPSTCLPAPWLPLGQVRALGCNVGVSKPGPPIELPQKLFLYLGDAFVCLFCNLKKKKSEVMHVGFEKFKQPRSRENQKTPVHAPTRLRKPSAAPPRPPLPPPPEAQAWGSAMLGPCWGSFPDVAHSCLPFCSLLSCFSCSRHRRSSEPGQRSDRFLWSPERAPPPPPRELQISGCGLLGALPCLPRPPSTPPA